MGPHVLIIIFIGYILEAVFSFFAGRSSRRSFLRNNSFYYDNNTFEINDSSYGIVRDPEYEQGVFSDERRSYALMVASDFVKNTDSAITLQNSFVLFIYNKKDESFSLYDLKNRGNSIIVSWKDQPQYVTANKDLFSATFDRICYSFSDLSQYRGIALVLRQHFFVVEKKSGPKTVQKNKEAKVGKKSVVIDINTASEKELATLPGITIIIAKKIVKFINEHGEFTSKEDFYKKIKIKPHFQKQLDDLISIKKPKKNMKNDFSERIIDF